MNTLMHGVCLVCVHGRCRHAFTEFFNKEFYLLSQRDSHVRMDQIWMVHVLHVSRTCLLG